MDERMTGWRGWWIDGSIDRSSERARSLEFGSPWQLFPVVFRFVTVGDCPHHWAPQCETLVDVRQQHLTRLEVGGRLVVQRCYRTSNGKQTKIKPSKPTEAEGCRKLRKAYAIEILRGTVLSRFLSYVIKNWVYISPMYSYLYCKYQFRITVLSQIWSD